MYKLLIVEDDLIIAQGLQKHFEKYHYEVSCVENFENVLDDFIQYKPDLVLLDIHLPFFDGYYWCQEIRKISQVPIVFISSANENMNIVLAMNRVVMILLINLLTYKSFKLKFKHFLEEPIVFLKNFIFYPIKMSI